MKIELFKEVDWDKTYYITKVDDIVDHYYLKEEEAHQQYITLLNNAKHLRLLNSLNLKRYENVLHTYRQL